MIGGVGAVINTLLLVLLHDGWRCPVVAASAVATETAVLHNYMLNERFTFRCAPTLSRALRFNVVSLGGMAITVGVVTVLTATTTMGVVLANGVAMALALAWNFLANMRWTWGAVAVRAATAAAVGAAVGLTTTLTVLAVGYANTPPVTAPPGSFVTVLTSATLIAGTPADLVSGPIRLQVPADALPAGTQVTVFAGNQARLQALLPAGWTYLDGYAVGWLAPDGTSPDASAPLTLTIGDQGISSEDSTYVTTSTALSPVTASVSAGAATFNFTTDPGFVVASPQPPPSPPVAGGGGTAPLTDGSGTAPAARSTGTVHVTRGPWVALPLAAAGIALAAALTATALIRRRLAG